MFKMPPNVLIGSLSRRRSLSAENLSVTPTQGSPLTPNTRKRQRLDYSQLYNRGRMPTPTPTIAPSPSRARPAMAQMQAPRPRLQQSSQTAP
jgi:hypothetical protein